MQKSEGAVEFWRCCWYWWSIEVCWNFNCI